MFEFKTVWNLISWLYQKPAELDLHCFQMNQLYIQCAYKEKTWQKNKCSKTVNAFSHTILNKIFDLNSKLFVKTANSEGLS